MNSNYALVTGASAGIGTAIAKELADRGYNLVLTARREDRLIQLTNMLENDYGVKAEFISADLSDLSSCSKIFNFCKSNHLHINFLVNNAGYGINKKFHETTVKTEVDFINVLSKEENVLNVDIILPKKISEKEINEIQNKLKLKIKDKTKLNFLEDENIISGFIIKLGSRMIDYSIKSKLDKIRDSIR